MIHILTFKLPDSVKSSLIHLPINEFRIVEISALKNLTQQQGDILLTSFSNLAKLSLSDLERKSLVVYTDQHTSIAQVFEAAKALDTNAVISEQDLGKLETIFKAAYQTVVEKRKTEFPKGKTIGVFSSKGGVGKSFISYHLAHFLPKFVPGKVILTDLGVPFGSLKNLLNIETTTSWQVLRPLLKTGKELTISRVSAQITHTTLGFDVLGTPNNLIEQPLSAEEFGHLKRPISDVYTLNVIDLPTSITPELETFITQLDLLVWVITPDSNSFRHAIEFKQFLKNKQLDTKVLFVCNFVEPIQDKDLLHSFEKMLGQQIFIIENDIESVKYHQRRFELFSDETFVLTQQLKELSQKVFFSLTDL